MGLLLVLTLAAYINCFHLGVALDGHAVTGDQRTHAATIDNLRLIFEKDYWWPSAQDRLYRPLTTLSFLVNYAVLGNGTDPAGYHAVNFLLHAINVWLVFALVLRLFERQWPAFFAAALWAVHPVGVDAVTNLAGRADLLATMGVLGGLLVYARICAGAERRMGSYAAMFALSALAVLPKESGAVLIGLMLLWDIVHGFGGRSGLMRRLPAYFAAGAALGLYFLVRAWVFESAPVPILAVLDNPLRAAGFWEARWTAVKVIGMNLWLLLWPANLASDRSFNQIPVAGPGDAGAWAALGLVLAILGVVIARRRKDPVLFWAAGFFGVALLPVSNLLVLIGAPMAERFLYLPSVGFAVAASALIYRFAQPRHAAIILGAVVMLCAGRTLTRNADWDNDLTLTAHDVHTAPASFRIRSMYGEFLAMSDPANLDRAIAEEEAAWALLRPLPATAGYPQIPAGLGRLYGMKGDRVGPTTPEGIAWHTKALEVLLRAAEIARATQQEFDANQVRHGKPLVRRLPFQVVYRYLALACRSLGRHAEAVEAYRHALDIDPSNPEYYAGIADSYASLGNPGMAATAVLEKGFAFGFTPTTMAELSSVYERVPGGACAITQQSGISVLNATGCPAVKADICGALKNLTRTYNEVRDPDRSREFRDRGAQAGCR